MDRFSYYSYGYLSYGGCNVYDLFNISHEYELIRIKWNDNGSMGYMDICPPALFEMPDCVGRFKKLVKLSAMSDIITDTKTIQQWRKAIKTEYDFCFRLNTLVSDMCNAEILAETNEKKCKRINAKRQEFVKTLDRLKKRVKKIDDILEDTALKYQIN